MLGTLRRTCRKSFSVAALGLVMAAPLQAETLADTLTQAYINSGSVEQNRALLRAADEDVADAMSSLRPILEWSSSVTRNFARNQNGGLRTGTITQQANAAISATIVLYAGGINKLSVEVAKESVLATRASLLTAEQNVLLRAASAFLAMREASENLELRRNNVRVINQELRAARDRFQVGEVTRTDVATAEAQLAAAQAALTAAEGALVSAGEEYFAAVGKKPTNLVPPTSLPTLPATVEAAKAMAVRQHPAMIQQQHVVAAQELAILVAKGAMKPTLSLTGRYGITEDFDDTDYSRGGSITLSGGGTIYQGGALASAVRQAMANRDAARAALHVTRMEVEQAVGTAYVSLRVARANVTSFQEQVRAANVAFQGVREEAKLGARTTLDVLDAEQDLLDARASLISAQVAEYQAAYQVLSAIGLMTADALKLNVPRFDPAQYYNLVKSAPVAKSKQGQELDRVLRALGKD